MENLDKNTVLAEIKSLKKAQNFDGMLVAAQKGLQIFPNDKKLTKLMHEAQALYVDSKLQSEIVKKLEKDEDYLNLQGVYLKLLGVFPDSPKLKKLLAKVKKKIEKAGSTQAKLTHKAAVSQVKVFLKEGKVDAAMQATYELLSYDPEDHDYQALAAKVAKRFNSQVEKELGAYFKTAKSALAEEFSKNKEGFICL
jgi:hypothetical protein